MPLRHRRNRGSETLTPLDFGHTAHEVVETFRLGLGAIDREGEVVVLEVKTHAGKVDFWFDARLSQLDGVACSRGQ